VRLAAALPRPVRALAVAGLAALTAAASVVTAPSASAYGGAPWFEPGKPYDQNFPDPHVIRVGNEYYAYATGTGGAYLPVSRSTDLQTWVAREAYDPGGGLAQKYPGFNDALPYVASWGQHADTDMHMTSWVTAPGVTQIGSTFVVYYGLWAAKNPDKHCISVATSSSPKGPFTDRTSAPLSCESDAPGDIDPYPFVDPATGTPYLLWASKGSTARTTTKIFSRQLTPDGLAFAPGSVRHTLIDTTQAWEGSMIENPAIIRYADKYFLLYSGNDWWTDRYAVGYAECAGPLGPCRKPQNGPILGNHADRLGPGGQSVFVDTAGRLRMAYHYWRAPYVGYPTNPNCDGGGKCTSQGQRRMAITELRLGGSGLEVGGTRPAPPVLGTDRACPSDRVPAARYPDVPASSTHARAIDCVTWWRVAQGGAGGYNPGGHVSRAQMASFLARAVLESGGTLPERPRDAFPDDAGSVHQDAINRLAAAGLVQGGADGRYRPDEVVTREQMATFLVRTVQHRTGTAPRATQDWFYDDETSAHQAAINAAAEAGLAGGNGSGLYAPRTPVRRDQMATFLSRTLQVFVAAGAPLPR
jgi:hypothetical protein